MQGPGSSRIFLTKRIRHEVQTDSAGIGILPIHVTQPDNSVTRTLPYHAHLAALKRRWRRSVPPLGAICIARLVGVTVEDINEWLPSLPSLRYVKVNAGASKTEVNLLNALADAKGRSTSVLPSYSPDIWFKVAMIFTECLPPSFHMKSLPLSDVHVPIIQHIDPSPRFTAITVLSLRNRHSVLDDSSIAQLKDLHQLAALDLSFTAISSAGIHTLSRTLRQQNSNSGHNQLAGPWKIRLLYLEACPLVDDRVCEYLGKWPLLSFVDLRGTNCSRARIPGWRNLKKGKLDLFAPSLVHPNHLLYSLQILHENFPVLFPTHDFPYALYINELDHPASKLTNPANATGDASRIRRRAGQAQDSDLAIFPANLLRKAIVRRAPVQEEDKESIIRMGAKDSDLRASGSDQFYTAQHRQRWRRAFHEDEDDIFGGSPGHDDMASESDDSNDDSSDDSRDTTSSVQQSEGLTMPLPNVASTYAQRVHSTHMQNTMITFFSKLPNQPPTPHGSPECPTSFDADIDKPKAQIPAPIRIPQNALHLIAMREPPPFLETLSLIQGGSSSSSDDVWRREQEILGGEAPARLRKRKSVDDDWQGAYQLHGNSQPDRPAARQADGGFWKDMQTKRQRGTESSSLTSPFLRPRQIQGARATETPTPAPRPDTKGVNVDPSPPTRRMPFGFAAKKTKR